MFLISDWAWWSREAHPRPTLHPNRPAYSVLYLALPCYRNLQQSHVPATTQCQQQRIRQFTRARAHCLCRSRSTRIVPAQVWNHWPNIKILLCSHVTVRSKKISCRGLREVSSSNHGGMRPQAEYHHGFDGDTSRKPLQENFFDRTGIARKLLSTSCLAS